MLKEIFYKIYKNPLGFIRHIFFKGIIAPLKYGKQGDYDAQSYWRDRFFKHGKTLKASGNEGLSEQENQQAYQQARQIMLELCNRELIDFANTDALEVGCGTGFYTQFLHDLKVKSYVGLDITDVLFPELQQKFPTFAFMRKDVTLEKIEGSQFDLILMIDVIEHIVTEEKLAFAMQNVQSCLKKNGILMLSPIMKSSKKRLFHLHSWTLSDIKPLFSETDFLLGELVAFRDDAILIIKKI